MKLFITNKQEFESQFDFDPSLSRKVHIGAFNELRLSIASSNSIPLMLTPNYDHEGIVLFDFVSKKGDLYFYQFNCTAK